MKLLGLISRTDLLHAELGKMPDGTAAPKFDSNTKAGAIMRKNVVIARVDSPLATACRVMLEKKLACLPVVLENGTLVGILTLTDFVKLSLSLLDQRQ
jgi:CBS domain-containing protein